MLASSVLARASVPPLLNYQGVLRDAVGDLVPDGNYSVTFRVWDAETSGTSLWQEGRLVTVQDGLFTVLLGSIVPIPDALFSLPDRWIGLQVGLDPEMSSRQRLVSVPFAWHSLESDKSDTASVARQVDTTGYSAYQDLLSEGRIGYQAGQVAAGDHNHPPVAGAAHMMRFEDTTLVVITMSTIGTQVIKSFSIPAGEIGHFMRMMVWGSTSESSQTDYDLGLFINDELAIAIGTYGDFIWTAELLYREGESWWVSVSEATIGGGVLPVPLNLGAPFTPITAELRVTKRDNVSTTFTVGEMIFIYDKD